MSLHRLLRWHIPLRVAYITRRQLALAMVLCSALTVSACSGVTVGPSQRPSPGSVPASPRSTKPSPSEASPAGPIPLLVGCSPGFSRCEDLPAGTYVTSGTYAFMPGLMVTVPAGWSSAEQDAGEFNLHAVDDTNLNNVLMFWRDVVAAGPTGDPVAGIGATPQDLADFLASDPSLIVSDRRIATVGVGIRAITLVISVNPTGPMDDPEDCPGDRCAFPLIDASHWDGAFAITVNSFEDPELACPCSHAVRLYLASIGSASDPHTFVVAVAVYSPDTDAELTRFEADVQPIIDSVRLRAQ
jgi:hypothetical protein